MIPLVRASLSAFMPVFGIGSRSVRAARASADHCDQRRLHRGEYRALTQTKHLCKLRPCRSHHGDAGI